MRLSADVSHPDYWRNHYLGSPRILIDGREIKFVEYVDSLAGFADVVKLDDNGRMIVENDCVATERVNGNVQIIGERRK